MVEDLSPEPAQRPFWARGWVVAAALLTGLVVIGLLIPGDVDDEPLGTPTTDPAPSSDDPLSPTTTLGYEEFTMTGSGNDTVDFQVPDDLATVLHFTHDGTSAFTVQTNNAEGEPIEMLVDTEGSYDGSRAVNLIVEDVISGIEVVADGDWSITATYLGSLERDLDEASGSGDDVLLMDITNPAMTITHDGQSEFYVFLWAFDSQGFLINDSGPIDTTVSVPLGGVVIEIHADGNWRLSTQG